MGKRILGLVIGVFLMATTANSVGAETPTYNATGIWNYTISDGWVTCPGEGPPGEGGTVVLTQTGATFSIVNMGEVQTGIVSGSRYTLFDNSGDIDEADSTTIVWDLSSAVQGTGYVAGVWSDGINFCNYGGDIVMKKSGGACVPTATTLCLNDGRFKVEMIWRDQNGATGKGKAAPAGTDDSGILFFQNPNNWEMLVKVLDGCSINSRYWIFFAATTDQEFTLTVTDTRTAQQVQYTNPLKQAADAVTDTSAFATCP